MIDLGRTKREWEPDALKTHHAPVLEGVNESVRLWDEDANKPIAVQVVLDDSTLHTRRSLSRMLNHLVKWSGGNKAATSSMRLSGIDYQNRTFGTSAPVPLRRRYGCSYDQFNTQYPEIYALIKDMTKVAWDTLNEYMPEAQAEHEKIVAESINQDWLVPGGAWTSGIINNTAALAYHKDSGNLKGTVSAMLGMRSRVSGGSLHMPEYDLTLGIPDGSMTFFDGQAIWHGVTPLVNERPNAYRYTVVWYAKSGIKVCGSAADEPKPAAKRATELIDLRQFQ